MPISFNRRGFIKTAGAAALASSLASAAQTSSQPTTSMKIVRSGTQPSKKAPSENFTGSVRVDPVFVTEAPARSLGSTVTFEPGARTNWHTHPLGQTIIIVSGLGWVQKWDGPVEEVKPGDVVWFPPGLKHWHGASPDTAMSHLAIVEALDGKTSEWLEKVTDEQYVKTPNR